MSGKKIIQPNRPLVSVVVAAYNENKYLKQALSSILNQENVNLEIIFVDDQSTDATLEIAKQLGAVDQRIKIFENKNKGKCNAFNFGVLQATGDFVCIFAGDDIMPAGSLFERLRAVVDINQEVPVVGLSKLKTISDSKKFDGHIVPRKKGVGSLSGVSPFMNRLALNIIFPTPSSLPNEDTWMELVLLHMPEIRIVHSDVFCCYARIHAGNSINMMMPFNEYNKKFTIRMQALMIFKEKFGNQLDISNLKILNIKISIEEARRRGGVLDIIFADARILDRLRALSVANKFLYKIRSFLYGLFSGW
jgi:glycosyltransferase involved in cell wall biosynthesis